MQLSSCVPATASRDLRRAAGGRRPAAATATIPQVIGLAEFMNFPGVLAQGPGVLDKLAAFQGGHIDGHAPLVRGYDLNAYLAARHPQLPRDDRRPTRRARSCAKGMQVLIREGTVSKDLACAGRRSSTR